ncbi:N-acetyltransferase DgcN [Marinobacterium jannaschii]|uniref:N-acetyltransferase DgcN n=1 Tax=Marinobacterium jannaschii TaxID=64970 RepID=UPI0004826819|nr:N-acetyltransferase DgcN [Marinobacterium jannaschii]
MTQNELKAPYLVFMGDAEDLLMAKVAKGVAHWRPEKCVGQMRLPGAKADLGLTEMSVQQAAAAGAKTFILGLAPAGGSLPAEWLPILIEAMEAGMDIASGLHIRLNAIRDLVAVAERTGQRLIDVREPQVEMVCGNGLPRSGKRLLAVGSDCCVGKMFSTLAIHQEMQRRGINATFRATGQTGILIEGSGVPVDAVISDFIAGVVEQLSPANDPDHWDIIEGQGSLFHPAYAGVSLGLLHGAQADVIIVCHESGRQQMDLMEGYPVPDLDAVIKTNLQLGALTNPAIRLGGIALNTSALSPAEAAAEIARCQALYGVPVVDPVRTGVAAIVDGLEG